MSETFTYEIGGKTYLQKPLVLGQIEMLAPIILKLVTGLSPQAVEGAVKGTSETEVDLAALYEIADYLTNQQKLVEALSIVLVGHGETLDTRDIEATRGHLRWHVDVDIAAQVIKDFFLCNNWKSLGGALSLVGLKTPSAETPVETT